MEIRNHFPYLFLITLVDSGECLSCCYKYFFLFLRICLSVFNEYYRYSLFPKNIVSDIVCELVNTDSETVLFNHELFFENVQSVLFFSSFKRSISNFGYTKYEIVSSGGLRAKVS